MTAVKSDVLQTYPLYAIDGDGGGEADLDEDPRLVDACGVARSLFACPTVLVSLARSFRDTDGSDDPHGMGEHRALSGFAGRFASDVLVTEAPLIVTNAPEDDRYAGEFLVNTYPFIRFYAGVPLTVHGAVVTGVFSLIDYRPWPNFGEEEFAKLSAVARLASSVLERDSLRRLKVFEEAQRARLIANASAGVVHIGRNGRIDRANEGMERLTGASKHMLLGAPAARFVAGVDALNHRLYELLACSNEPEPALDHVTSVHTVDGARRPVRVSPACDVDETGVTSLRLVLEPMPPDGTDPA